MRHPDFIVGLSEDDEHTGQATSPSPAEVFSRVAGQLLENGVSERDVRRMMSDNPGNLVGV